MRKLMMQRVKMKVGTIGLIGLAGLLALALAAPAAAGTLFKWTGPDGGVSYTDDLKRVPEQHRASAERVKTSGLGSYERYTPEIEPGKDVQRDRLNARLARLRAFNAEPRPTHRYDMPVTQTVVRMNDRLSLSVPNEATQSSEPVVLEELRVRDPNSITTRHVTVVKQGDRVISVIRPKATNSGAGWAREADLLPKVD